MSEDNSFFDSLVDENENVNDDNKKIESPKVREFSPERKKQFNKLLNSMMFFWVYNCYTHSKLAFKVASENEMKQEIMNDLNKKLGNITVDDKGRVEKSEQALEPEALQWFVNTLANYARRRGFTKDDIWNYIQGDAKRTVGTYNYTTFAKKLPTVDGDVSVVVPTIKILKVGKFKLNKEYKVTIKTKNIMGHVATRIAWLPYSKNTLDALSKELLKTYIPALPGWKEEFTKKIKEKFDKTVPAAGKKAQHGKLINEALAKIGDAREKVDDLIINVLLLYKAIKDRCGTKNALADYVVNYSTIKPPEFGFVAKDWGELKETLNVTDPEYDDKQGDYSTDEPINTLRKLALQKNQREAEIRNMENARKDADEKRIAAEKQAKTDAETKKAEREKEEKENLEKLKKGAKFGLAEVLLEEVDDGEETDSVETCSEQLKRIREECLELLEKIEKPSIVLKMGDKVYLKVGGITDQLKETEKVGDYRKLLNGVLDAAKKNCDSYLEDVSGLGKKRLKEVKGILDQEIKGAKKFINSDTKLDKMFYLTVESLVEKDNIKKPMELLKNRKKMDTSELFKGEYKNDYEKILKKIETQRGDEPLLKLGSKTGNIIAHFWVVEQKIKKYTNKMGKNRLEIVESKFNNSIETFHNNLRAALEKAGVTDLWSNITNTTVEYEEEKKNQEEEKKRRLEESKTISGISDLSSSDNSSIISDSSKEASINKIKSVKMTDMENLEKSKTERDVPIQDIKSRKQSGTSGNESTEEAESTVYKRVKSIKSADGQSQNEYEKENETDDDDDLFVDEESSARRHYSDADA